MHSHELRRLEEEEERALLAFQRDYEERRAGMARMRRWLDDFEGEQAELDYHLIPLQRTLTQLRGMEERIENNLVLVQLLADAHELAGQEEGSIGMGPSSMEGVEEFVARLSKCKVCIQSIEGKSALAPFSIAKGRLESVYAIGMRCLLAKFQEWLGRSDVEEAEGLRDACHLIAGIAEEEDFVSAYVAQRQLKAIGTLGSEQGLARYVRHSHPWIVRFEQLVAGMRNEEHLALHLLPSHLHMPCLKGIVKPACENLLSQTAELVARVKRGCQKRQFADQVYLFDLIEVANEVHAGLLKDHPLMAESLSPSVKALVAAGRDWLSELEQDCSANLRSQADAMPPPNATVLEQASMLVNAVKRLVEYDRVVEAMLKRMEASSNWDLLLGVIPHEPELISLAFYIQNLLKMLEETLANKCRSYRKILQQSLFELNNANYLLRSLCLLPPLNTLVTRETEQRLRSQTDQATKKILAWWSALVDQLRDIHPQPPKDRLKAFGMQWEEGVKLMTTLTVPDADLRKTLQSQIKDLIMPILRSFYTQHGITLHSTMTKYGIPELSGIEAQIDHLFEA